MKDKVYKLVEVGSDADEMHVLRQHVFQLEARLEVAENTVTRLRARQVELDTRFAEVTVQVKQLDDMLHNLLHTTHLPS